MNFQEQQFCYIAKHEMHDISSILIELLVFFFMTICKY
jgi:hypothetical protein